MVQKHNFYSFIFLQIFLGIHLCFAAQNIQLNKAQNVDFNAIAKLFNINISSDIKKYYSNADKVDGWFDKRLIIIYRLLDECQAKAGIVGNLGEIGVWQGKSFIPLMHLARNNEFVLAVDCFESYQFNRDNSGGVCNFTLFTNNIKKHCSEPGKLRTIKGDSYKLAPSDYLNAMENAKGFRIFSIDGCHEAATTATDMENAFKCLVDGGIVMMDDYFHSCWPGVSEGVNAFMNKNANCLKPFLIAWNKVFFTQPEHAATYKEVLEKLFIPNDVRRKKFFDVETLIYDPQI